MVQQRGKQLTIIFHEETSTANFCFTPEGIRLRAREQQVTTDISKDRNRETDYQGQLPSLELESERPKAWSEGLPAKPMRRMRE